MYDTQTHQLHNKMNIRREIDLIINYVIEMKSD